MSKFVHADISVDDDNNNGNDNDAKAIDYLQFSLKTAQKKLKKLGLTKL